MSDNRYEARLRANQASKDFAENDKLPWGEDEIGLLLTWDRTDEELTEMAFVLGRTREACRERFYLEQRRPVKRITRTRTETVETTYYSNWDPEDTSPWYK